jgi:hypothetical protein
VQRQYVSHNQTSRQSGLGIVIATTSRSIFSWPFTTEQGRYLNTQDGRAAAASESPHASSELSASVMLFKCNVVKCSGGTKPTYRKGLQGVLLRPTQQQQASSAT